MCVKEYENEGEGGGEDEVGVGEFGLLEAWSYFYCVNITTIFFFFSTFDFGGGGGGGGVVVDEGNGCDERWEREAETRKREKLSETESDEIEKKINAICVKG